MPQPAIRYDVDTVDNVHDVPPDTWHWRTDRELTDINEVIQRTKGKLRQNEPIAITGSIPDGYGYIQYRVRNETAAGQPAANRLAWPTVGRGVATRANPGPATGRWTGKRNWPELQRLLQRMPAEIRRHHRACATAVNARRRAAARSMQYQLLAVCSPHSIGWETEIPGNALREPEHQEWFPPPSESPALAMAMADLLVRHDQAGARIGHTADSPTASRLEQHDEYLAAYRIDGGAHGLGDRDPHNDLSFDCKYLPTTIMTRGRDDLIRHGWKDLVTGQTRHWGLERVGRTRYQRARDAAADRRARERRETIAITKPEVPGLHPVVARIHTYLCRIQHHVEHDIAWSLVQNEPARD